MIHLKIILQNNPQEIQQFDISHGFNILLVNHTRDLAWLSLRAGAGVVIAHPENIVRGLKLQDPSFGGLGYYITGPCFQAAVEKQIDIIGHLYLSFEGKVTAAYAKVPVHDGHAIAPHAGVHLLGGLGYRFGTGRR